MFYRNEWKCFFLSDSAEFQRLLAADAHCPKQICCQDVDGLHVSVCCDQVTMAVSKGKGAEVGKKWDATTAAVVPQGVQGTN